MVMGTSNWPAFPDDPQTTGDKVASVFEFSVCLSACLFWANFLIYFCSIRLLRFKKTFREWIPMYWHRTHKTSLRVKNTIRELMPCTVGAWWCGWGDHGWLGVGLIKCCDCQRSLLARSISDPSVLATRGAYVFIFSFCCVLSVCNVFTTPRAGHQSRPLPLVSCIYEYLEVSMGIFL